MKDKFKNYSELKKVRPLSSVVEFDKQGDSYLIFTPHGGGIEPGTTEICKWFNKHLFSYYSFTGSGKKCMDLHITSPNFDEPILLKMLTEHFTAISFHGMTDGMRKKYAADIFLGGLDKKLVNSIKLKLQKAGYSVTTSKEFPNSHLAALSPSNVTNKGLSSKGVQIELSDRIRKSFFKGDYKYKNGRRLTTENLNKFCNIIKTILEARVDKNGL